MSSSIDRMPNTVSPDRLETNDEKRQSRRRSIIREFCLNTSTHALPGIARSESIHNRVFWSISFLIFTGIMIYFLVKAILAYFEYPTKIDVNYVGEWRQYFPAFSICHGLTIRFDQFIRPFLNYTNTRNLTNTNDTTTISLQQATYITEFLHDQINRNEPVQHLFYSLPSILVFCSYNSQPCSATDFIPFISSTYGMCYTFNAKLKDSYNGSLRYASQYGGDGKLSLGLYLHSHQFTPYLGESIGFVGLIHDNTQLPLIEAAGIELAPGRKHKLGYKKKTTYLLPSPYTTCTNNISLMMKAMFNNYYGADYSYSETICYQLCGQVYTYEQCGCVHPYLWNARSVVRPGTDKIIEALLCRNNDTCFSHAFDTLLNSLDLINKYCSDCSEQCSITDFIVQTSSSGTPFEWQMDQIKKSVENSKVPLPENWSNIWREHIHTNYLAVNVVRETNVIENNTQTATLSFVDVLSNVGGQTGLWLGISFLSIMEFIEMLYRLIRYQCSLTRLVTRKQNNR